MEDDEGYPAVEAIIEAISSGEVGGLGREERRIAVERWEKAMDAACEAGRPCQLSDGLTGKHTVLVVVDMQRAFIEEGAAIEVPAGREIVGAINCLASSVRSNGGRVVYFRYSVEADRGLLGHFEGRSYIDRMRESPMDALKPGHEQFKLVERLDVREADRVVDKNRYSAVLGSDIVGDLKAWETENVIVCGVTTDVCAGNTAEDLMQMGFRVSVAWDGTAALGRLEHELYLARLFGLYADVMPIKQIIRRLE